MKKPSWPGLILLARMVPDSVPADFPTAFLDADGKPIPDTYNLTATYKCPVTSTTLTAATTVTICQVELQAVPVTDSTNPCH